MDAKEQARRAARDEANSETEAIEAKVDEDVNVAFASQDIEMDAAQLNKTAINRQRRRLKRHVIMMEETGKQSKLKHYIDPARRCPSFYGVYRNFMNWLNTLTIFRLWRYFDVTHHVKALVEGQVFEVL